jgi:arylsulfatase
VHEGGISTPLIVHWPGGGIEAGGLRHQPAQLPDIMATLVDLTGATVPETIGERRIQPCEGISLADAFAGREHARKVLTWEHEGNCGVRKGKWKLVREYIGPWAGKINPDLGDDFTPGQQPWELYDIEADRAELHDLASERPDVVEDLLAEYRAWADRCGVQPWDDMLRRRQSDG